MLKDIREMERRERVYEIYKTDNNNEEYKISAQDFRDWLKEDKKEAGFIKDLKEIEKDIITIYDVAVDYSITVSLVKFFMKEYL